MSARQPGGTAQPPVSVFLPVLLLALALLLLTGFQTWQLLRERDALHARVAAQEEPLAEAGKVREQVDSVARATARLAAEGNANAKRVIEALRRAGITVDPDG